jgi:hypothetical protein
MPTWPPATNERLKELSNRHKANLRAVADAFASFNELEHVSLKHVNDAHSALGRIGLTSEPWYRRTELESGCGGLCFAAAAATPDIASAFFDSTAPWYRGLICGLMGALGLIGAFFLIHAWFRGQLPTRVNVGISGRFPRQLFASAIVIVAGIWLIILMNSDGYRLATGVAMAAVCLLIHRKPTASVASARDSSPILESD